MQAHRLKLPDGLCFGSWVQTTTAGVDGLKSVHIIPRKKEPDKKEPDKKEPWPICGQIPWLGFQRVFPRPGQTVCPKCMRALRER